MFFFSVSLSSREPNEPEISYFPDDQQKIAKVAKVGIRFQRTTGRVRSTPVSLILRGSSSRFYTRRAFSQAGRRIADLGLEGKFVIDEKWRSELLPDDSNSRTK